MKETKNGEFGDGILKYFYVKKKRYEQSCTFVYVLHNIKKLLLSKAANMGMNHINSY